MVDTDIGFNEVVIILVDTLEVALGAFDMNSLEAILVAIIEGSL